MDRQKASSLSYHLKLKVNNLRAVAKSLNGNYNDCLNMNNAIGDLEKSIYSVIQELDNESKNTEVT